MFAPARRLQIVIVGAVLAVVAGLIVTPSAWASHEVQPARVSGGTRADTAANVADLAYPDGTDTAFLARDDGFADALAAAALAGFEDAPLLLTDGDELTDRTDRALQDLGVGNVTVLGGEQVISRQVEEELDERYAVGRIAGEDRYRTAADLTVAVQRNNDNQPNFPTGRRAVFVANGQRFPDALTAGAPAAAREIPTVLVTRDDIPQPTADAVQQLDMDLAIIVGGTDAVSEDVRDGFEQMGINTVRVAGATRSATATELADFARDHLGFDATRPLLARGGHFADALAAGPLGGIQRAPILLTATPDELGAATGDWMAAHCPDVEVVRAVGGELAISPGTLDDAVDAARRCHDGTGQTYIVSPQEPIQADPGHEQDFAVSGRYDDQAFTGPVDIVLFPCGQVDVVGEGQPRFTDADDDGKADGIEATDTDAAVITYATGTDDPGEKGKRDAHPDDDGLIGFGVASDATDCAVPTAFADRNDNSALDLDADDRPVEPYGVGRIGWN